MRDPGRALGISAKFGSAALSRNNKAASPAFPSVIIFYAGKGIYVGKFVRIIGKIKQVL